jgi:Zn finger protein HypA/HybF involved in hydrogenase expression
MNGPIWGSGNLILSRPPKKHRCARCGHRFNNYKLARDIFSKNIVLCCCPQCDFEIKRVYVKRKP